MVSKGERGPGKVTQSEKDAKFLLEAAAQLEARYPFLKRYPSGAIAIRRRFRAVLKRVSDKNLDRRGSLIGGAPFLSKSYPVLQGMAPLLQVDLGAISKVANEKFGSGLLQVWMPEGEWGFWGDTPYLHQSHVRVIPKNVVSKTKSLLDMPHRPGGSVNDADQSLLDKIDPNKAKWERDKSIRDYHHDEGVAGYDWSLSCYGGYVKNFKPDRSAAPQQIVKWIPDGFSTNVGREAGIWGIPEEEWDDNFDALCDDPDFAKVDEIACKQPRGSWWIRPCTLFGMRDKFLETLYLDNSDRPRQRNKMWRPLLEFAGPLGNGDVVDDHMVFYRRSGRRVEFAHGCIRCYP